MVKQSNNATNSAITMFSLYFFFAIPSISFVMLDPVAECEMHSKMKRDSHTMVIPVILEAIEFELRSVPRWLLKLERASNAWLWMWITHDTSARITKYLRTSFTAFMDWEMILRSRNSFSKEESWLDDPSVPFAWICLDDWKSSMLSRFRAIPV